MHMLIIPIYNGEKDILTMVLELQKLPADLFDSICIVNDGSTDKTLNLLTTQMGNIPCDVNLISYDKNRGKGYAIAEAVKRVVLTRDDILVFTDVDIPYGVASLTNVVDQLKSDDAIDMVVGNRKADNTRVQYTPYRAFAHALFRILLPRQVRQEPDTQCGLKGFRGDVAQILFSQIQTFRWVFDIELFLIARTRNMKIITVPVSIEDRSLLARGNLSFLRHGISVIHDLLRIYFVRY